MKFTTKEIVNCSVPSGSPSSMMFIIKHLPESLGSLVTDTIPTVIS